MKHDKKGAYKKMAGERFRKEQVADMKFIVDESTMHQKTETIRAGKAYSTSDLSIDDLVDLLNDFDNTNKSLEAEVVELQKELTEVKYYANSLDEDLDVYRYRNSVLEKEALGVKNIRNLADDYNLNLNQIYDILLEAITKSTGEFELLEYKKRVLGLVDDVIGKRYNQGEYFEESDLTYLKEEVEKL